MIDCRELTDFYYETLLGRITRRHVRAALLRVWPKEQLAGHAILGLGYATPYLRPYTDVSRLVFAGMPDYQGVLAWPRRGAPNVTFLYDSQQPLPLPRSFFDRILVAHSLEHAPDRDRLLEQIVAMMSDKGRVLFVLPNRLSQWARDDNTPFGDGHPYSPRQLGRILNPHGLHVETLDAALFFPPRSNRFVLKFAALVEKYGKRRLIPRMLGGVLLVEASYKPALHAQKTHRQMARAAVLQPAYQIFIRGSWQRTYMADHL